MWASCPPPGVHPNLILHPIYLYDLLGHKKTALSITSCLMTSHIDIVTYKSVHMFYMSQTTSIVYTAVVGTLPIND